MTFFVDCPSCSRAVRSTEIRCPFCEHALPDLDTRLVPLPPPPGLSRAELDGYRRSPRFVRGALASAAVAAIATSGACSSSITLLYGAAGDSFYVPGVGEITFGAACNGEYYAPVDSDGAQDGGYAVCDGCEWGYSYTVPAGFILLDGRIPDAPSTCPGDGADSAVDGDAGSEAGPEAGSEASVEAGSDVSVDGKAGDSG
jgi:hypothetical protein